jgi:hypothetical protein
VKDIVKGDASNKRISAYHHIKDELQKENTYIEYIPSRLNLADKFTKPLSFQIYNFSIAA